MPDFLIKLSGSLVGEGSMQAEQNIQGGERYTLEVLCAGVSTRHADLLSYAIGVNGDDSITRWPAHRRTCGTWQTIGNGRTQSYRD